MKVEQLPASIVDGLIKDGMVCPKCRQPHGELTGGQTRVYMRQRHVRCPRFPAADGRVWCYACVVDKWEREVPEVTL